MKIKIVQVPDGEAPLWVREQWVGLTIPLDASYAQPSASFVFGVLSGKNVFWRMIYSVGDCFGLIKKTNGYTVNARLAVAALNCKSPDAAKWWVENCSYLLGFEGLLLFQANECEIVTVNDSVKV
ncbi:MAG: hypothetical protein FD163_1356 [Hyphomonadaceae bacterium]|nr:MAG: hypothetical protein FD128_2222 [Hyphomonadaceae bacterium]KAF0185541.1 MAG: hypothetical protein FD163_1356 [Hyphomonadaceae bacterium]